ncbi:fasciclin 3 isoform X2 [Rhodnius prolixus]|uniref:fasciclin 3 isoform X2 n=1 Tax=Rhodnius prolixus TaxID=13249 RepID=UPI003D18EFA8
MSGSFYVVLFASLLVKGDAEVSVSVQPQLQIAKEGEKITALCRVAEPLETCYFDIPSEPTLSLSPSKPAYMGIKYFGEGLERGFCGMEMVVQNKHNGLITCTVTPRGESLTSKQNMTLIVARKPSSPELSISKPQKGTAYLENEQVAATCTIRNGRPVANITWYIGESKITDGLSSPSEEVSPKDSLYTIKQTLTRKLRASDNNKALKCVAGHMLLSSKEDTTIRQLAVFFGPKPSPEPLEHFGLVEGEEGKVTVTVIAFPKPSLTWMVGDLRIHEGETDESGRFKVLRAAENQLKGSGYWESVLIINPLEKEDVEREYVLTATNTYGEQTYKVAISTNPEPRMLELGAGTIVGIVVAILLILIITSILVFARAKGRWCFAGKARPRLVPETSDTESAEHHHPTPGPKAKMTFTKVFKKKSDKVGADEEEIKDVTVLDEKNVGAAQTEEPAKIENSKNDEGVVYAELDLQQHPAPTRGVLVRPEDDKTEYAEIIHTQNNNK